MIPRQLVSELQKITDLSPIDRETPSFDPGRFDIAVYQLGNNADHEFVYSHALRDPGVAVLHEANLHHLVADATIRRGDWDAYVRECEYDGGPAALRGAQQARTLTIAPDYENVPMLRRIAFSARGIIAHSEYVMDRVRAAGYTGPGTVIPHGAWVDSPPSPEAHERSRAAIRHRLGLEETTPLIGAFGYIKPYKRIAETLRALRRIVAWTLA